MLYSKNELAQQVFICTHMETYALMRGLIVIIATANSEAAFHSNIFILSIKRLGAL